MIDESACLAHGDCAELAPDVFRLERRRDRDRGRAPSSGCSPIAEACPAAAIIDVDEQTGEQAYP